MNKHIDAKVGLAYLDGHLDAAQRAKLERHLADCTECQMKLRNHQAVHDLLQAAGESFVAEPTQIPVWTAVRAKQIKQPIWRNAFGNRVQLAVAAAAMLFLLAFGWQLRSTASISEPAASGLATATPTAEPEETTSSARGIPTPSANLVLPQIFPTNPVATAAAEPVELESPQPISGSDISEVHPNSQGRIAFVADDTLYIEVDSTYTAVADHVLPHQSLVWSPDGQELLFFRQADEAEPPAIFLWQAQTNQMIPLSDLITRALPETGFDQVRWSEYGRELLLRGQSAADSEWDAGVWLADLDSGRLSLIVEARSLVDVQWLNADSFMLEVNCGDNCAILMGYDRDRNMLWKAYADQSEWEAASEMFVHQEATQRIFHLNIYKRPQTVDLLDTATGEIHSIWTAPNGSSFAGTQPYIAPNGRFLIFQTQDENEQIVTQVLDVETGRAETAVFPHPNLALKAGAWNPAGDIFSYVVSNPGNNAAHIYLWHMADGTKELVHTSTEADLIRNFVWTNDGERLFFNSGSQSLWQYNVASGELYLVTGQ